MKNGKVLNPTSLQSICLIYKKQKIADYSTLPVTKEVYADKDNATRMQLRNEHLEQQFMKNQSDIK